jgi:hypothetical protein
MKKGSRAPASSQLIDDGTTTRQNRFVRKSAAAKIVLRWAESDDESL